MDVILVPVFRLAVGLVELYIWVVVISVLLSWLVSFNVINSSNRFVYMFTELVYRVTEPALRPIRRFVPVMGGFDLSPVVLIFLLIFLKDILIQILVKFA